ncbi:NUDIX hydrolase [Nitrosococcus oceani ATCC 19707]|uniref:NUDIX hydrolase n=2 Tax=Nitrosococcus oceani TaxID=1229 RepID=Q3JEM0_NITOC|nr:NUDIX domain-containing protein [Nitrosococcus oceani]ABA56726.1 NUDIX hydrolase [Nitrosococcus oceani ATCC 19707]EDZ65909.1 hydrolase, NUDIX family, putative [Nitrosococcus oceani AFC27]KFI20862.1 NUDIX hydrolase [Nitrosococcus oceani C-27]GEM21612.1 NUDIX hydrolase [Nitrosococcus oceani]
MSKPTFFVVAVAVFLVHDNRFLALRRSTSKAVAPGAWEVISGKVERGELPHETARRETYEETGITVALDERPVTTYQADYGMAPMIVLVYRGKRLAGEASLSSEHEAMAWVTEDEFAQLCLYGELVEAARWALKVP